MCVITSLITSLQLFHRSTLCGRGGGNSPIPNTSQVCYALLSLVVFSRNPHPHYAYLIDTDQTVLIISPFANYIEAQLTHKRTCIHPLNQDVLPVFSYITMTPPLPPYVPLKDFQNPLAFNSTWTDEYVAIISNICSDHSTHGDHRNGYIVSDDSYIVSDDSYGSKCINVYI